MRKSHFLVLAVVVVLLIAGFLRTGKLTQAQAERDRAEQAAAEPSRAVKSGPSGRERCKQKCATVHKGYVYRARQKAEAEYCGCA